MNLDRLLPLWTHLDRGLVLAVLVGLVVGLVVFWTVALAPNREDDEAWAEGNEGAAAGRVASLTTQKSVTKR